MLKYENLLTSPITTLVELFSHLNLDFDFTVADSLYNHTRISKSDEAQVHKFKSLKYYSTYRTADYDIYKWKTELPKKKIRYVEENCLNFMNLVGYEKYTS